MEKNDILLIHGTNYQEMTKEIMQAADVAALIGDKNKKIGMKPNLAVAKDPKSGATTHAELLAGVIEYLQENGFYDISIMEGSWVGDRTGRAFKATGYDKISKKYNVPLIDLQKDSFHDYDAAGMRISLCDAAASVDFMINMPVLKGHCQTTITCALKNNKGVIPNDEKRRFHTLGLHKPIAHLNTIAKNNFILVDNICGDLDFEEGGNPVTMNRILGFRDPVLCDAFVCESLGYLPSDVEYIILAEKLGIGSANLRETNRIMLNEDKCENNIPQMTRKVEHLAAYTEPMDACSACYGSLIHALNRLDEKGRLGKKLPKIAIGQGYQKKSGVIGIGRCTGCFKISLEGCPPKAADIVEFLEKNWKYTDSC